MNLIDQDLVNGLMKAWLFQFSVIPKLAWPFQVYDFPLEFAKKLDVIATRFLKKWVGLYNKADTGVLFRARENLGLGLTRPSLLFTQLQLVKLQLVKYSQEGGQGQLFNLYQRRLEREKKFTRRWKPAPTLEDAEAKLSFELKFAGQTDRKGLGFNRYKRKLPDKVRRKRISLGLAGDHDRKAELHSMSLALQGGWTKWKDRVNPPDLKWKDLIFMKNPKNFSHRLNATINCLPTPCSLKLWGFIPDARCPLCEAKKATQMHIYSNCKTALLQGRYSWRHDSVLVNLEPFIRKHVKEHNEKKLLNPKKKLIKFVRPGASSAPQPQGTRDNLLDTTQDWQYQVDYRDKEKVFPTEICVTGLRPDIVIWSAALKKAILVELTCPSEDNMLQAKARKSERYQPLLQQITANGWTASLFLIEAGVTGCLSRSFAKCLRRLGMMYATAREACKRAELTVSRCSYIIFQAHKQQLWANQKLLLIH